MLVVPVEISVLLESDFADVGRPMVHLYTLDQQAVLATMEHFQSLSTGLVQPVVATYSMMQLYKAAGLVQPVRAMCNLDALHEWEVAPMLVSPGLVTDDAIAVLCHVRDCSTCCAR